MDKLVTAVLAEFDIRAARELREQQTLSMQEGMARRDEWLIHVGPASGQLLNLLIRESGAKRIVEFGTSYGYSTVWLADAARATGGKVITLEIHPGKQAAARDTLTRAGLAEFVDFRLGDALEQLQAIDTVDFVLLDIWKELYVPCFDHILPKLASGRFIAADNMLYPPANLPDAERYRAHVRQQREVQTILLPVGSGIELTRKN